MDRVLLAEIMKTEGWKQAIEQLRACVSPVPWSAEEEFARLVREDLSKWIRQMNLDFPPSNGMLGDVRCPSAP